MYFFGAPLSFSPVSQLPPNPIVSTSYTDSKPSFFLCHFMAPDHVCPRLSALQLPALTRSTWSHGCSPTLGSQPCNRANCLKISIWWCQSERLSYHTLKELIQVSIVCSYHMLNLVYIFLPISQGLSPLSLFQNAQLLPSEEVSSSWGFPPPPSPAI